LTSSGPGYAEKLTGRLTKDFGIEPSIEFGMLSLAALPMSGVNTFRSVLFQPAICKTTFGQTES
tara:strand:- start:584 stop:775 length:192 start_codon:yes stop_codon:yes gene_type:complete